MQQNATDSSSTRPDLPPQQAQALAGLLGGATITAVADSAVELRLGKIRGRLPKDLIGSAKLAILSLELLDPSLLLASEAATAA